MTAQPPLVTVVIPCYGQAEYLPDAVASVVAQTYGSWELVIVDDGSPDDTPAVARGLIERHPDRRILLVEQPNAGLAGARNAGIAAGSGAYVLPLDADDAIAPEMLERTVSAIGQGADVAHVATEFFGGGAGGWPAITVYRSALAWRNRLPYCSLFRRGLWEASPYSPDMGLGYEDWDLWLSFAEAGAIFRAIDEPLFRYRARAGTMVETADAHRADLMRLLRDRHPESFSRRRRLVGLAAWILPALDRRLPAM